MGKPVTGFLICSLLCSLHLSNQQALYNSGEVSVTAVNDSSASMLNSTTTPQTSETAAPETPTFSPNCNKEFSCRNRCNKSTEWDPINRDPAHCHCDQACLEYHDCCADFAHFCLPANPVKQVDKKTKYSCAKLSTEFGQTNGIYVISTCAEGWKDEDTRAKCLAGSDSRNRSFTSANIFEDIPVTPAYATETTYRNIYCGRCNNAWDVVLLLFWQLKFRCNLQPSSSYNDTQALDFMLKYCPSRKVQPQNTFKIRTCLPIVSTCSLSNLTEHKDECAKGISGVVYSEKTQKNYKNYDCLRCNELSTDDIKCGPRYKQDVFKPKSFEIVMEFIASPEKPEKPLTRKHAVASSCGTDTVYDPHLEICRKGFVPDPSTAIRDKYRVKLWMYPTDDKMTPVSPDKFRDALCTRFSLDPSQIDEISIAEEDGSLAVAFNLYAGPAVKSNDTVGHRDTLNVSALLTFNQSFEIIIESKTWTVLQVTRRQLACVQSKEFLHGEFELLPDGSASITKTNEVFPPNRYFLVKHDNSANQSLFICNSKFTVKCPFVLLPVNSSEYKIFYNKSLLHNTTGRIYTIGEYDLDGRMALICTNYTTVNYTSNTFVNVTSESNNTINANNNERGFLWYFTVIGFSVSIFTLILTLAVHFIFSELRSPLPGKNLMSLCVALSLVQFTWLLGTGDTDKPIFCTAIAAVLHYLFLASFACTAIIAFDTRRTFSSQISKAPGRSIGTGNKNRRFMAYTCVAWGGPLLFVGVCFLLDHFQVVYIGYGSEKACWLVKGDAKIITFVTPIACVLLYNVAAFSHTMWAISTARKQTTRVKSARQDRGVVLKIYVRLISLMGFTWFFSFSAEFIHRVLIYPFVVLTTLQGMYIFVAFVCKSRVLKLLKDSFPRSRNDALASTQHTSSTVCKSLQPAQYRSETENTHM